MHRDSSIDLRYDPARQTLPGNTRLTMQSREVNAERLHSDLFRPEERTPRPMGWLILLYREYLDLP